MRFEDLLTLRKASIYAHPADPGETLPLVFGDFITGETRDPLEQGGCLPTRLIDRLNWIYLLSDSVIADQGIELYARRNTPYGSLVNASQYTFHHNIDIEGQGQVSVVQFNASGPDPSEYEITWRGLGSVDASQTLIADPVNMVYLMYTMRGNWVAADFDPGTVTQAQGIATAYGIPVHWVFDQDVTYGQSLTEIFENYLADVIMTPEGKLSIRYNLWPLEPIRLHDIAEPYLDARVDAAGARPAASLRYRLSRENLTNAVVVKWRHNWVRNTQATQTTFDYRPSQEVYKERRVREYVLKGIRWETHLNTWIQLLLSPLVELPGMVEIPLKAILPYRHLQRGSYVALNWDRGPDTAGQGWTQRILRVLGTTTDYVEQTHTLQAFDTRFSVIPPQAVPFRDQSDALWYLRIKSEDGTLEFVSSLAFPWVSAGTERHWVERLDPAGTTIYVYPDTDGSVLSSASQPGTGSGDALGVDLVDHTFRHWDIQVGASPGYDVTTRVKNLGVKLIGVP